ncbi:MAG: hypothetical protein GQ526_01085 [Ardenticatenales bacterium]|nr:hypothetical protein [Ardenticatenales bacterium]
MTGDNGLRAIEHPGARQGIRRLRLPLGLALVGVFSLVALVVLINDSRRLLDYSFHLDPLLVLLSFVIECSGLALAVPVWRQILARLGSRSSYRNDLRIYCYSMLGVILPGGFWPMVGRAALYERQGISGLRVAAASIVEFVVVGLAGLLVYSLATLLDPTESVWQRPVLALAITVAALALIHPPVFNRIIRWLLQRSRRAVEPPVTLRYAELGRWVALEGLVLGIGGTAVYVLLRSLAAVPPSLFVPVVGAWAAAAVAGNLFFWMPGTPVVRDGAMALVLTQSLPLSTSILFVLLIRVWTIFSILAVAVLARLLLARPLRR